MAATATRKMASAQASYLRALAAYEAVKAEAAARKASLTDPDFTDEADVERYVDAEMAIEQELSYWHAFEDLRSAETHLIAWGTRQAKRLAPMMVGEDAASAARMIPQMARSATFRPRLLDLLIRLDTSN